MVYIVYKTTCLVNNKIYIGVHQTENPNIFDGYLGRGFFINRNHYLKNPCSPLHYAIIKYGVENFKRETLYEFNTEEEAYKMEEILVTEEFIKRSDTYNVAIGGKGRPRPTNEVYQFSTDGELINSYKSAIEASKIMDRNDSNIRDACVNKRTCAGFL